MALRQAAGDAELLAEDDNLVMDVPGLRDLQFAGRYDDGPAPAVGLPRLGHDEPLQRAAKSAAAWAVPPVRSETATGIVRRTSRYSAGLVSRTCPFSTAGARFRLAAISSQRLGRRRVGDLDRDRIVERYPQFLHGVGVEADRQACSSPRRVAPRRPATSSAARVLRSAC